MGKNYTKTEKFYQAKENSIKNVIGVNEEYWNNFKANSGKSESSLIQYRSAVRRVLEHNSHKDALEFTSSDIQSYLDTIDTEKTKENQKRYVNSFLTFTITHNMEKAIKITDSNLILSLIPEEYKGLMRVLLNK